ncbi:MAG: hypothetical protein R3F65_02515 [bacterium]
MRHFRCSQVRDETSKPLIERLQGPEAMLDFDGIVRKLLRDLVAASNQWSPRRLMPIRAVPQGSQLDTLLLIARLGCRDESIEAMQDRDHLTGDVVDGI